MFGNSVVIIIFGRRKFMPAILLFLVLTALDMSLLLCQFLFTTMPILCTNTSGCGSYANITIYLEAYAFPFVVIIYCTSSWVVVLMAYTRFLAITKPLEHHRIITTKYIFIELIILLTLCVAYNFPRFFEYDLNQTENSTSTSSVYFSPEKKEKLSELFKNKYYQIYYKILSFLVLMISIPLVLLSYLTFKLIREIKRSNARRKTMLQGSRLYFNNPASEELSITITLLVVVIAFILFHVPMGINRVLQLFFYYKYNSIECVAINNATYYVSRVFNTFAEINAASNFIIYGVTSSQFRHDLQNLFTLKKTCTSTQCTQRSIRNMTTRTLERNSNRRNVSVNKPRENFAYLPEFREISV